MQRINLVPHWLVTELNDKKWRETLKILEAAKLKLNYLYKYLAMLKRTSLSNVMVCKKNKQSSIV